MKKNCLGTNFARSKTNDDVVQFISHLFHIFMFVYKIWLSVMTCRMQLKHISGTIPPIKIQYSIVNIGWLDSLSLILKKIYSWTHLWPNHIKVLKNLNILRANFFVNISALLLCFVPYSGNVYPRTLTSSFSIWSDGISRLCDLHPSFHRLLLLSSSVHEKGCYFFHKFPFQPFVQVETQHHRREPQRHDNLLGLPLFLWSLTQLRDNSPSRNAFEDGLDNSCLCKKANTSSKGYQRLPIMSPFSWWENDINAYYISS